MHRIAQIGGPRDTLLMKIFPVEWDFFGGAGGYSKLMKERKKGSVVLGKEDTLQCGGRLCN